MELLCVNVLGGLGGWRGCTSILIYAFMKMSVSDKPVRVSIL